MALRGSLSRSLMSTTRASAFRSSPSLSAPSRLRHSLPSAHRLQRRRLSFSNPRTLGELGCSQSLMPLHSMVALASHLAVNVRAFCELSQGMEKMGDISSAAQQSKAGPDTIAVECIVGFCMEGAQNWDLGQ